MDVQYLIDNYETVRSALMYWLERPDSVTDFDPNLAEFAIVSGDRAFWEPYACLMGFCAAETERTGQRVQPSNVLLGSHLPAYFEVN